METHQKQQQEQEWQKTRNELGEDTEVAPGISIVRSNTPRPVSYQAMLSGTGNVPAEAPPFPARAPSAPPLPEEIQEREPEITTSNGIQFSAVPLSDLPRASRDEQEFYWLFEYGLEMDSGLLNSPEHLDGAALYYGPGVLKGYTLLFGNVDQEGVKQSGHAIVTMVPSTDPQSEVWGVLYRIPRRVYEQVGLRGSLLDNLHARGILSRYFRAFSVMVRESYRENEFPCITYCMTEQARQQIKLFPLDRVSDTIFVQRMAVVARKQKLPDHYVHQLSRWASQSLPRIAAAVVEPRTEPLPTPGETQRTESAAPVQQPEPVVAQLQPPARWLTWFAVYLMLLLICILGFSVVQGLGYGRDIFTSEFRPLGVPWLVLVYGVLGGCVSSIVTLGWYRETRPPFFVILTWFTRPFIGAVLAILTYLFLTSGFFIFNTVQPRYTTISLLAGALAGLCEGWLFMQQRRSR